MSNGLHDVKVLRDWCEAWGEIGREAGRRKVKVIYLAHPISGDVQGNLVEAKKWIRWLYDNVPGIAIVATWIVECEVLDEGNPEHRKLGLQHDVAVVGRCDAILLVGPKLSPGMQAELIAAEAAGLTVFMYIGYDRVPATVRDIRYGLERRPL